MNKNIYKREFCNDFAKQIRDIRSDLNLTLTEVSERSGFNCKKIEALEQGNGEQIMHIQLGHILDFCLQYKKQPKLVLEDIPEPQATETAKESELSTAELLKNSGKEIPRLGKLIHRFLNQKTGGLILVFLAGVL